MISKTNDNLHRLMQFNGTALENQLFLFLAHIFIIHTEYWYLYNIVCEKNGEIKQTGLNRTNTLLVLYIGL